MDIYVSNSDPILYMIGDGHGSVVEISTKMIPTDLKNYPRYCSTAGMLLVKIFSRCSKNKSFLSDTGFW